ncbi:MAG: S-layer domain protein, partial [Paenibacillus sp.]|nr:S-layer domain protein [Paenibacillus sp.]
TAGGTPTADKLTFVYPIVSGVNDSDGIQVAGTIDLQGGAIRAATGNAASLALPAVDGTGVTIDTIAPDAPLFITASGTVFPSSSPVISGTAEPGSTITVQIATYAPVTSAVGPDGKWSAAFSGVSDGTFPVNAKSIDRAGNESLTSTLSITVDSVVPNKPVLNVSEPNWTSSDVTVEAIGAAGNVLEIQVGLTGPWTPYGSPVTVAAEGITTVSARQTSPAGNTSEIASADVKIDKTSPVILLLGSPEMTLYLNSPFQDPGTTVTDNIDSGLTATVTGNVYAGQTGTYMLRYHAIDSAGNAASEVSRTVHVVPAPVGLRWDPSSYTIRHRGNGQAAVKLKLSDGTEFNVTAGSVITYSIPGIAELRPDGTLSGLQPGTTVMHAVYGGQSADAAVFVERVLERIEFGAASYSLEAGQSGQLTVRAVYSDGGSVDVTPNVSLRIDNPNVATITGQTLRGVTAGRTALTAEWSGQSATIQVTVTEPDDGGGDDGGTDPGTPSNPVHPTPGNGTDNGSDNDPDNKTFVLEIMVDGIPSIMNIRPDEIADDRLILDRSDGKAVTLDLPLPLVNQLLGKSEKLQLELNTASGSIRVPLGELLRQAKAESEGSSGLRALSVGIAPANETEAGSVREALSRIGVPAYSSYPVRFAIGMELESGHTLDLSRFQPYVTRTIPAGADKPASGAAGFRWNASTGEVRFVPTTFRSGQGREWIAELNDRSTGVYFTLEHPVSFPDVAAHWARKEIELLASMRVVQGRGDAGFDPNGSITRAELAALLTRVLGLEASASEISAFRDVTGGWYMEPVAAASAAGLVTGYEDGSFRPNAQVTRQEIAVMLLRALRLIGAPLAAGTDGTTFADQADIPDWAAEAVSQAAGLDITEGDETGSFRPADPASRAEASVMLLRFMRHASLSPW